MFETLQGLYHFNKMLFGLHGGEGAFASFQRVMNKILAKVSDCAITCTDDILVYSLDWATHLMQVLQAIWKVGLIAHLNERYLGQQSVQYLALVIDEGGLGQTCCPSEGTPPTD